METRLPGLKDKAGARDSESWRVRPHTPVAKPQSLGGPRRSFPSFLSSLPPPPPFPHPVSPPLPLLSFSPSSSSSSPLSSPPSCFLAVLSEARLLHSALRLPRCEDSLPVFSSCPEKDQADELIVPICGRCFIEQKMPLRCPFSDEFRKFKRGKQGAHTGAGPPRQAGEASFLSALGDQGPGFPVEKGASGLRHRTHPGLLALWPSGVVLHTFLSLTTSIKQEIFLNLGLSPAVAMG